MCPHILLFTKKNVLHAVTCLVGITNCSLFLLLLYILSKWLLVCVCVCVQGRLFSYGDTHRHRLGANFHLLPVNQAKCKVANYQRDGPMCSGDNQGVCVCVCVCEGGACVCVWGWSVCVWGWSVCVCEGGVCVWGWRMCVCVCVCVWGWSVCVWSVCVCVWSVCVCGVCVCVRVESEKNLIKYSLQWLAVCFKSCDSRCVETSSIICTCAYCCRVLNSLSPWLRWCSQLLPQQLPGTSR